MQQLRRQAEVVLSERPDLFKKSHVKIDRLLHELEVYKIELDIQQEELLNAQKAVEDISIERNQMYRALSHDLKQPVFSLQLFLKALASTTLDQNQQAILSRLVLAAESLAEISAAMSDLGNAETKDARKLRPVPLEAMLRFAANDYLDCAVRKGLRICVAPTKCVVLSEPFLLRRVVSNLIANAVRYTDSGGIVIGVRRAGSMTLRIEVWDTGAGIPQESLERIFNEFYQVGNAERNPDKGMGIGLAVVQRLATMIGEKVSVRSTLGKGSVFAITVKRYGIFNDLLG